MPKFGSDGLLTAVVTDADRGRVLMVAFMDTEALEKTRETGLAHFHSRSRGRLWMKGESSGNVLRVARILVDCDQDALVIEARPAGPTCHTGAQSCFFRALEGDVLVPVKT
ncbi:MAG: phosphoribosyl-AMP cyclohydrolase [Tsuneonella sp.]